MTHNQIEYFKYLETKRSNLAGEALTQRRDEANIKQKAGELSETKRHNRVVEDQALEDLGIKRYSAESGRITSLANAKNADTNSRNADTNAYNAQINAWNASTNARNAATNERLALEAQRHNQASESIERSKAKSAWRQSEAALQTAAARAVDTATNQGKLSLDTEKWLLQSGYTEAEIELLRKELDYYGAKSVSEIAKNWGNAISSLAGGIKDLSQSFSGSRGGKRLAK